MMSFYYDMFMYALPVYSMPILSFTKRFVCDERRKWNWNETVENFFLHNASELLVLKSFQPVNYQSDDPF